MKNKKSFKIILLVLVLIVLFLVIRSTYSKYVSGTDNQVDAHISKWHILLNNNDIMTSSDFTQNITLTFDSNSNIANGVIVPTSRASFDLELESTGTEVPFEYNIKIANQSFKTSFSSDNPDDYITTNGTNTTYEFTLDFDYPGDGYVWQDNGGGNYDYICPPIELTVPTGFLLNQSTIDWLDTSKSNTQNGNKVTLYALRTAWDASSSDATKSSNHFSKTLSLTFDHALDLSTTQLISGLKVNNKEVSSTNSSLPDFRISQYTVSEERESTDVNYVAPSTPTEIVVPRTQTSIIGTVNPAKNTSDDFINTTVKSTFHFVVEWYDGADNILNNQADVAVSKNSTPEGTIPIEVKVTQIEE